MGVKLIGISYAREPEAMEEIPEVVSKLQENFRDFPIQEHPDKAISNPKAPYIQVNNAGSKLPCFVSGLLKTAKMDFVKKRNPSSEIYDALRLGKNSNELSDIHEQVSDEAEEGFQA